MLDREHRRRVTGQVQSALQVDSKVSRLCVGVRQVTVFPLPRVCCRQIVLIHGCSFVDLNVKAMIAWCRVGRSKWASGF